ncbi:hypothetical protein H7X46_26165 [Pseudonocardia sp. C8]|uniref:hypothetical protein n=1 Tax=Pseudonocardia sp. C8 TaxID=2762759 RepID=UPI0016426A41|nr:hypothetical protein [Pseudonocardia sp. C8]MBC3194538.1 hypothetical protein [Pseudonocardia sp. C8]
MPADVSARLRAQLAAALAGSAHPDRTAHAATRTAADRNASRSCGGRNASAPARIPHRARRAGVVLAAAAVVGALVALPVLGRPEPGPAPIAATTPDALRAAAAGAVADGAAADPDRVRACLTTARDPGAAAPLVASRPYPVAGEPGVLLVLGTPQTGRYRVVVVAAGCGRVLAETTVP